MLITGGAGYIGSHTAKALAAAGYEPVVLDDLSSGHSWAVRWGPLVHGDIGDRCLVQKALERYAIEAVIHFAASAYVGESVERPRKYFQNNVTNSLVLLNAILDAGIRRLVFSSTCAVYGIPQCVPIDENQTPFPVNPYGESKLFVERALKWYGQAYDLQFVSLRYFNAAGADPEGEIGECHDPETHLIPLAIRAARNGDSALRIYGTDFDTEDGTAVRDYVHVSDLADAHVQALGYLAAGGGSTAINLGTGTGHSVRDVQHTVELVSGRRVSTVSCCRRPGDPSVLVAKTEMAAQALGWKPRYSDLSEIVDTAWRWHSPEK